MNGNLPKKVKNYFNSKTRQKNSSDTFKFRPRILLNIGGKVLDELHINRINHHMYKNELLTDCQYGFTPQKNKTDAAMEGKFY